MSLHEMQYKESDVGDDLTPHPVIGLLDRRRRATFVSRKCFPACRIVSICWKPPGDRDQRVRAASSVGVDVALERQSELIAEFDARLADFEVFFRSQGLHGAIDVVREKANP